MYKEPIAIIGIGCRFPGANNPQEFWQLLREGIDAISEVPSSRWDLESFYDPDLTKPNKMNTRWGGFLEQIDQFEPQFFSISPKEAISLDPQQRLLLEVTWEALEDAGINPELISGTKTGVFVGISSYDYYEILMKNPSNLDFVYLPTGNTNCIAAHRLSYVFNLNGPSMVIDTACSSSLVGVHLACQSIWNGESTLALVGGVHVMLSPWVTVGFAQAGFMSPDGRCKAFDASANGYVRGEGAGMVILKSLSEAIADGDSVYAVIRGSSVNQDGRSNGLTAPNPRAQESLLREAYQQAGVSPAQVQYIEAHGTGTSLGDLMEMKALGKVLAEKRLPGSFCKVGSVKTNIGHLEAAAGIAGLIKLALSLNHRQIPPSLHFNQPNPYINFDKLPLRVQDSLSTWEEKSTPIIAGVSSFSFGGTNAHVVLEEASRTRLTKAEIERPLHLLTLSARSQKALQELALKYQKHIISTTDNIADICFSANKGRLHFKHRLSVLVKSTEQLHKVLASYLAGQKTPEIFSGIVQKGKHPKIAFLFTGQGSQYAEMGAQLYEQSSVFRETINHCDFILRPYLDKPLLEVLYVDIETSNSKLNQTAYTQPALFALEYALFQLWKCLGICPDALIGHSLGEYVAACVAGVFSLEDALKLVAERSRLMQSLPDNGAMAAVFADKERVLEIIADFDRKLSIAAINGPKSVVISGDKKSVQLALKRFESKEIATKPLKVSHAFHSPLIEPIIDKFFNFATQIQFQTPRIPLISNLTGQILKPEEINAIYWCRHMRESVLFEAGMKTLAEKGYKIFLEIGPRPTLVSMGKRFLLLENGCWLSSLQKGQEDWQVLLRTLAVLETKGINVDWAGLDRDYQRTLVRLPTYPFERKRYWIQTEQQYVEKEQHPTPSVVSTSILSPAASLANRLNNVSDDITNKTTLPETSLERIITQQLAVMSMQLQVLGIENMGSTEPRG